MKLTARLDSAAGIAGVGRLCFVDPVAPVQKQGMRLPRTFGATAAVMLGLLGQGGCMTASFISQAFVQPGPPVVTGVISAGDARDPHPKRLLVRYTVLEPIMQEMAGSHDYSAYGYFDFTVPLEPDGRPVAPYHYVGTERTAEGILQDLGRGQREAVRHARLRRVPDAELLDLQQCGHVAEAAAPGFGWEFIRLPTAREEPVAVLAFRPRGQPEVPRSTTPAGMVPAGATVLLLPASQRRPPMWKFLSTVMAVAGPYFAIVGDVVMTPFYLVKSPPGSAKDRPAVPATGRRIPP